MGLSSEYRPRRAAQTELYQILDEHLGAFLDHAGTHERTVPSFVRKELEAFLTCGILEHGFGRAVCPGCRYERLVPFSCGGRGFCPSCMGRRMADTAARLVDGVLPHTPMRQWVLSLPHALRFLLAYNSQLCTEVLSVFTREVFGWLEQTARRHAGVDEATMVFPGAVTALQRADSAAKLNLHFHTIALDGVYVLDAGADPQALRFVATPAPTKAEVSAVAWATCLGTMELLKERGLALDADISELDPQATQYALLFDPMLAQCAQGSMLGVVLFGPGAGKQILRLGTGPTDTNAHGRAAHGFDLHADTRISAHDRKGLQRLCKYILRPPIAHSRIERTRDGRVKLRLKRSWADGTTHLVFTAFDFIARLVALVPPPRTHRVRYHGVLASHHRLRAIVTPQPPRDDEQKQLHLWRNRDACPELRRRGKLAPAPKHRIEWHQLMARTFGVDPMRCPMCRCRMKFFDFIKSPARIAFYLARNGIIPNRVIAPNANMPRGPPQLELPFAQTAA